MTAAVRDHARTGMRAGVVALVVALLVVFGPATGASANADDDVVRDLTVEYQIDDAGTVFVTETFEWDFGTRNGLGFYRSLVQQMGWAPDTSKTRVLEYSDFAVSSPSGAPAEVWVENSYGTMLTLAVGAPDGSSETRTGVQTYVLTYQVEGAINAVRGQEGVNDQDELFYNVFSDSPNTVDNVSVTVTGPADVVDVACYTGAYGDSTPCADHSSSGSTAHFSQAGIGSGGGLTVMAAYPADTFSNPGPILEDRPSSPGGSIPGDPSYEPNFADSVTNLLRNWWGAALAVWAAILGLLTGARIRRGRDRAFVGLPPGQLPARGEQVEEERMAGEPPVAVRFHPPDGLRPAEAEVIEEERVSDEAFTATMIDLAVRGYFTIRPAGKSLMGKVNDWELTLNPEGPPRAELTSFEDELMRAFFSKRTQVKISKLKGDFASKVGRFNKKLIERSDSQGWFTRTGLVGGGGRVPTVAMVFLFMGVFAAFSSGGSALLTMGLRGRYIPLMIAGALVLISLVIAWIATAKAAHARSAYGRALYEQIRGFREYLTTAEAHQLRWEADEDIFSKYLPWAITFGVADRWTSLFARLAEAGVYTFQPVWYVGYGPGDSAFHVRSIGESVKGIGTTGMSTLTYTPGSSGGSGSFSGGGGFSGGGVGGGSFGGR